MFLPRNRDSSFMLFQLSPSQVLLFCLSISHIFFMKRSCPFSVMQYRSSLLCVCVSIRDVAQFLHTCTPFISPNACLPTGIFLLFSPYSLHFSHHYLLKVLLYFPFNIAACFLGFCIHAMINFHVVFPQHISKLYIYIYIYIYMLKVFESLEENRR